MMLMVDDGNSVCAVLEVPFGTGQVAVMQLLKSEKLHRGIILRMTDTEREIGSSADDLPRKFEDGDIYLSFKNKASAMVVLEAMQWVVDQFENSGEQE